eukprot:370341-Amphidinium_carterae.1
MMVSRTLFFGTEFFNPLTTGSYRTRSTKMDRAKVFFSFQSRTGAGSSTCKLTVKMIPSTSRLPACVVVHQSCTSPQNHAN